MPPPPQGYASLDDVRAEAEVKGAARTETAAVVSAHTMARVQAARPDSLFKWADRLLTAEKLAEVFGR
jgi:N6-adenosine-specific RNA methylase IME4